MSSDKKRSLEADLIDSLLDDDESVKVDVNDPTPEPESDELIDAQVRAEIDAVKAAQAAVDGGGEDEGEIIDAQVVNEDATATQIPGTSEIPFESPAAPVEDPADAVASSNEHEGDNTVQIDDSAFENMPDPEKTNVFAEENTQRFSAATQSSEPVDHVTVGRNSSDKLVHGAGTASAVETSLAQSENLRVAQNRIIELEAELERCRQENEQLAAAGETLRRKLDDLAARAEKAELSLNEEKFTFREEKRIYRESLEDKDRESARLREKVEELELRLESDLKKIRIRERELENRLELVKMEEAALLRNKDEIILDLKRKIDQLTSEVENYRGRSLELHKHMESDQDRLRRTVRALRLALSMLEDGDGNVVAMKKAE